MIDWKARALKATEDCNKVYEQRHKLFDRIGELEGELEHANSERCLEGYYCLFEEDVCIAELKAERDKYKAMLHKKHKRARWQVIHKLKKQGEQLAKQGEYIKGFKAERETILKLNAKQGKVIRDLYEGSNTISNMYLDLGAECDKLKEDLKVSDEQVHEFSDFQTALAKDFDEVQNERDKLKYYLECADHVKDKLYKERDELKDKENLWKAEKDSYELFMISLDQAEAKLVDIKKLMVGVEGRPWYVLNEIRGVLNK